MRLLVIEDDPMIGEGVRTGLRMKGYTVDWVRDGRAAELALANGVYSLALLDLGLPRKDGLTLLKDLRAQGQTIPVLILTARDALSDRVAGLNAGADDYLVKPFHLEELAARVHALLRRQEGRAQPVIRIGPLSLDPVRHEVRFRGQPVSLSRREFSLLHALMAVPGAVLSRQQLEDRLYGWDEEIGSNAVEVYLHNLRKKLGPEVICNLRGVGYKVVDVDALDP